VVTGFGPDTFVNVDRNEDSFQLQKGVDGEGCRSANNNFSGRITCTLMQSSKSNNFFAALMKSDEISGDGVVPVLLEDGSGPAGLASVASAENAWLVRPAPSDYARATGTREWIIESDDMEHLPGSN
jgi:hypothetical protein